MALIFFFIYLKGSFTTYEQERLMALAFFSDIAIKHVLLIWKDREERGNKTWPLFSCKGWCCCVKLLNPYLFLKQTLISKYFLGLPSSGLEKQFCLHCAGGSSLRCSNPRQRGGTGNHVAFKGSWSWAIMYTFSFIYKKQSSSAYSCEKESEDTVLFHGRFHDIEIHYILEILKLLFALAVWHWPELSRLLEFKLMILDLPVSPRLQGHQQFSLNEEWLKCPLTSVN